VIVWLVIAVLLVPVLLSPGRRAAAPEREISGGPDALVRIAATRGLHNAGMREIAAEAGVSVRLAT
jgi:AcrR family transcriptional regulator